MFDRVQNMLRFWFWIQLWPGFWISLNNYWTCLKMPKCENVCKSALVAFVLFSYYNKLSIWMCDYLFQCLYETRSYSLRCYEVAFLKRQNLIFSVVAGSIWFILDSRFKSKNITLVQHKKLTARSATTYNLKNL